MEIENARSFFILGGIKCGTTFLFQCLKQHPDICGSKPKEPTFFMLDQEFKNGLEFYFDHYYQHYQHEPVIGEARTHNLYLPWVPQRIFQLFPEALCIVLVRNPVDRAYSDYLHARRHAVESRSFTKAIYADYRRLQTGTDLTVDGEKEKFQEHYRTKKGRFYDWYLEAGQYVKFIDRYRDGDNGNRVMPIFFSELIETPQRVCNKIFSVLGLSAINLGDTTPANTATVPRSYALQSVFKKLGRLPGTQFIPNTIKKYIERFNLQNKEESNVIDPIAELWLYHYFEQYNVQLNEQIRPGVPDHWFRQASL